MQRTIVICFCIFLVSFSILTCIPALASESGSGVSFSAFGLSEDDVETLLDSKEPFYVTSGNRKFYFSYSSSNDLWIINSLLKCTRNQTKEILLNASAADTFLLNSTHYGVSVLQSVFSNLGIMQNTQVFDDDFTYYAYLLNDNVSYNSESGDISISSDSVDKLREEIKTQYYSSIGVVVMKSHGAPSSGLMKLNKFYEYEEDYQSDIVDSQSYNCALGGSELTTYWYYSVFSCFNSDFSYCYFGDRKSTEGQTRQLYFVDSSLSTFDVEFKNYLLCSYRHNPYDNSIDFNTNYFNKLKSFNLYTNGSDDYSSFVSNSVYLNRGLSCAMNVLSTSGDEYVDVYNTFQNNAYYYSKDGNPLLIFKSYEALYNYAYGSQTAYLGSQVNQAADDIILSIDDMNANISDKMDELIENINNNKSSMTAEELQSAIDKGLESLTGKIEEIGENTEETNQKLDQVNDTLSGLTSLISEQNQILLDILGVTEYIAYNTTKEDGSSYTFDDVSASFASLFNGVEYAFLYGINIFGSSGYSDSGGASTYSLANNVSAVALYSDDSGAGDDTSEDLEESLDYHNGILGKFPFSVPYQLYEWLQVLCCEPVTPTFEYKYGFLIGQKDNESLSVSISMAQFDDLFKVSRSFLKLSFTLLLSVSIYHRFKGEF